MPTTVGPNTYGEENLVFGYDLGDVSNSYKGEPTVNTLIGQGWWGDGSNQSFATKTAVAITDPTYQYKGLSTVLWTPGDSYNCYLHDTDINSSDTSTVWTFSCYIKRSDGGTLRTSDNNLYVYLYFPSSDGADIGTVQYMGDGWYRVWRTRTGSASYISLAGFTGFAAGYKYYLSGWQLEKVSHPTPSIPINTTRSATQGLIDLTGNSTIDLTNVSFDSNAQMTFDGTDDVAQTNLSTNDLGTVASFEFVFNPDIVQKSPIISGYIGANPSTNRWDIQLDRVGNQDLMFILHALDPGGHALTTTAFVAGNYYHVVYTINFDTLSASSYVNGVLEATSALPSGYGMNTGVDLKIGDGDGTNFAGEIPLVKIYNRALTASEVASNFKAIKGRFNI